MNSPSEQKIVENLMRDKISITSELNFIILCDQVKAILATEANVIHTNGPAYIAGDLHGQFQDLKRLFELGGSPKEKKYVFVGDYVDRGFYSIEVIQLLFSYKVMYPSNVILLRGNHESRDVNSIFGFYNEVSHKYGGISAWEKVNEVFQYLPIAAVIDKKYLCLHGGLSKQLKYVFQINLLDRIVEPNHLYKQSNILTDILWSDPNDKAEDFIYNREKRAGSGCDFGIKNVKEFCHRNNLEMIVRGHEVAMKGFEFNFLGKTAYKEDEKRLVTVFSAPNYEYSQKNTAGLMVIDEMSNYDFMTLGYLDNHASKMEDVLYDLDE